MASNSERPLAAIACGGTGGHLFPGIAVAGELMQRGCGVLLLISPKEVDQQAVESAVGMQVAVLPAVGLVRGRVGRFLLGTWQAYREARRVFRACPPKAVLAMGGFTCAAPIVAGRRLRAATFLHESNTIPGKANRWIGRLVDQAFVGFPSAAGRLRCRNVQHTGTPVRPQFRPGDATACRQALGLDAERPTVLIMGGSQGAVGVNRLVLAALPALLGGHPGLQFLHLTGPTDFEQTRAAYEAAGAKAVVRPFLTEMELALGAATAAVSRAGGSSLAELAAMWLPAVLIPYPSAADNHQFFNAQAFVESGAALMIEQRTGTGEHLAQMILPLVNEPTRRAAMAAAMGKWHAQDAAAAIAGQMLSVMQSKGRLEGPVQNLAAK